MILSALVMLSQQMIQNIFVGSRFDTTMINREKAEIIALSGINVAMALLQEPFIKDPKKQTGTEKNSSLKEQLASLLPLLNQWRTFPLSYDLDGVDGNLSICITSEEGKIPLNQVYDMKSHTIKAPFDALIKKIPVKKIETKKSDKLKLLEKKDDNIADALITFFKKRDRPLDEISELFSIDLLTQLPLWYDPPFPVDEKPNKNRSLNQNIGLQDIFSLYNKQTQLHPLLLTDALKSLLEVGRVQAISFEKRKENLKPIYEKYQENWGQDWIGNWKNLQALHPQNSKSLSFFKDIFTSKFEPTTFSVLSSGIVQGIEQRVCAIITKDETYKAEHGSSEKIEKSDNKNQKNKAVQKRPFKVLKLYWV